MERNIKLLFRAINAVDLYIYQRKVADPESFEHSDAISVYNDWIHDRGFSVGNEADILYLISHIERYCNLSVGLMRSGLIRSGLVAA